MSYCDTIVVKCNAVNVGKSASELMNRTLRGAVSSGLKGAAVLIIFQ